MSVVINRVRSGFYLDSVALMRLSVALEKLDGVESASMMIATPSNRQILSDAHLLNDDSLNAGADDLIIALRVTDESYVDTVLDSANNLLADGPGSSSSTSIRPRTLDDAVNELQGANLALISVPGDFAAREAANALNLNLNAMIFSDNVSIEDERALKELARQKQRLVMGPDCGTAIINGVPLAFANQVPRGDVGIVAASGTGLQEVVCLLARVGRGVSQAIGTGGRDMTDAIGGLTTVAAIEGLAQDCATKHIVVISKPPGSKTAPRVLSALQAAGKPATVCFIGADYSRFQSVDSIRYCRTLSQTAQAVSDDLELTTAWTLPKHHDGKSVHGLFAGGTLCAEAQLVFNDHQRSFATNVPIDKTQPAIDDAFDIATTEDHCLIDLGADEYTRGRPHPMLEPQVRANPLRDSLHNKHVGVVLIDVVLGYGSHANPAGAVVDTINARRSDAKGELPSVVASVCGTDADPQSREQQVALLQSAGVTVASSNALAAMLALKGAV